MFNTNATEDRAPLSKDPVALRRLLVFFFPGSGAGGTSSVDGFETERMKNQQTPLLKHTPSLSQLCAAVGCLCLARVLSWLCNRPSQWRSHTYQSLHPSAGRPCVFPLSPGWRRKNESSPSRRDKATGHCACACDKQCLRCVRIMKTGHNPSEFLFSIFSPICCSVSACPCVYSTSCPRCR